MPENGQIPGYDFGSASLSHSPVSLAELRLLEQAAGFDQECRETLRKAAPLLAARAEELVDQWRAAIAVHPEMVRVFFGPGGRPDEGYKAAVKKRFVQWVKDVCEREHDQAWLDYQEEIGRRHTPAKKNATDGAQTPPFVPMRYLVAFAGVISTSIGEKEVQGAWTKSMLLHLALWVRPYVKAELW